MAKRSRDTLFVSLARELGWRAYAIPVLIVITIWVLVDVFSGTPEGEITADGDLTPTVGSGSAQTPGNSGPNPADSPAQALPPTELPPGGPYAERGDRTYRVVGTPGMQAGEGREKTVTYVVEVENGVDTAGSGGDDALSALVDATLSNPKGWTNDPRFRFVHVAADQEPDMRIQLTSVDTTHAMCGSDLEMETSCHINLDGVSHVVINESRWVRGATTYNGDLGSYRQYLLNHEVGHGIGYAAHEACGSNGELAPIMMQQTLSLNNRELHSFNPDEVYPDNSDTCVFNPWPYPRPAVL